jgi:diacylglycerol O-acyltransferase / wax synthase
MEWLSGLDASFLYIETPSQPLNVCSILVLDTATMPGGYTFARLREELALRIKATPEFREKLADSPLKPRLPGLGRGQGLRHRSSSAPHRPAASGTAMGVG